jgi:diguanylate cyclase (GGDEF)-like protein/PAS domain S-box-containing protein
MINEYDFLNSILDTVTEHIVIIDKIGDIKYVNRSWIEFGKNNSCLIGVDQWENVNYLKSCENSEEEQESESTIGIKEVLEGKKDIYYFEYPCHSPTEKRWFMMRVVPLNWQNNEYFVISHHNITERKLAEEKVLELTLLDGLTNIANRRAFDKFLSAEINRCKRKDHYVSLAILDIDYFKVLNDTYGHQVGDEALIKISSILKSSVKRTNELVARYGGEEFAIIFGDSPIDSIQEVLEYITKEIKALSIENKNSKVSDILTISIGLVTSEAKKLSSEAELIHLADIQLYNAKNSGRDKTVYLKSDNKVIEILH